MAYRLDITKELAIYTWIHTISPSLTVIWDKPNVPRPALPYATMNISSSSRHIGNPEQQYKETDTFTHIIRNAMTLTVNIYADTAYLSYIETLINSLNLSSVQTIFRAAGMANWGSSNPTDISQLLDTKYEFRISADFFFSYTTTLDDICGEIQKVSIEGTCDTFVEAQDVEIT